MNNLKMNATVNPNKALWEKGDFTRIAVTMRESGEAFVQRLGIKPGIKVLDLGCGDGTTALPAAKLGAEVLGVDIASNLVVAGNHHNTAVQNGEVEVIIAVGLPDGAMDLGLSPALFTLGIDQILADVLIRGQV